MNLFGFDSKIDPHVNLFAAPNYEIDQGVWTFGFGNYSRKDILAANLGVDGDEEAVSSVIVRDGGVAIFFDRDNQQSE